MLFTQALNAKDKNILAYKDRGVKYYPKYVRKGLVKIGKASWYGKPFHGRLTANGERYNMYSMTAAHRTYAMGTRLKITNLKNKRSVLVRVNDRGPFYSSRSIDLSYGAAKRIGMVKSGIGRVKIEVLSSKKKSIKQNRYVKKISKKRTKVVKNQSAKKVITKSKKIQLASFLNKENAYNFKKIHQLKDVNIVKYYITTKKKTIYRVIVKCSPYTAQKLLKSKKFLGAYLVS